jgi:flagellar biosynthesis protein
LRNIKKAAALKYEDGTYAPKVVAKASGVLAQKIVEEAENNGVPVVENPHVAALLVETELMDFIPEQLFEATATILAYIYNDEVQEK